MQEKKSQDAYREAIEFMPGGVNSPVRAFKAVGGIPRFIASGKGCKLTDIDGNSFTDYVCSWGPLILGHAHPAVIAAVERALHLGASFGAPTLAEIELARRIVQAVPSIEKVRLVNSGTEAAMSALRLARGFTGRDKVVKFEGCYHGHADGLLVAAGSGAMTFGVPTSPGVPSDYAHNTIVLPFNDPAKVRDLCQAHGKDIAAIIVEPVAGNMGVVPPEEGFLEALREITTAHGIILIFDEVITGFRLGLGGAQRLFNIIPDITLLGKIIGGGLPVGAYGGRAEIMDLLAPEGPVYQAGTLSGNPLAVAAGIATLEELSKPGVYERLDRLSQRLAEGLERAARDTGIHSIHTRVGAMQSMFFTHRQVKDYASATSSDTAFYAAFFAAMLKRGVYLAPSQFEATFVSLAHTETDIDETIEAAREALREARKQ